MAYIRHGYLRPIKLIFRRKKEKKKKRLKKKKKTKLTPKLLSFERGRVSSNYCRNEIEANREKLPKKNIKREKQVEAKRTKEIYTPETR